MRFTVMILVALIWGCADTHQVVRGSTSSLSAPRHASAYIGISRDGSYGRTVYHGSGALAAQAVDVAFAPYFSRTVVGVKSEDFDTARASARAAGHSYLLFSEILQWEDRATEWSAKPDVAAVKVSIVKVDSGEVLDSAVIQGASGLATFGGDRPEHLLPKPMAEYAAKVFTK